MATPRKRATARPKGEDRVDFKPSGTIVLSIAGVDYRLRRPLIGEQRRAFEGVEEVAAAERAEKEAAAAEERPVSTAVTDALLLDWWRTVVLELTDGTALPADDDDDLPVWLTSRELLNETRKHWLTVPWGPGGSPTEQQAQKGLDLLKQVAGSLPAS